MAIVEMKHIGLIAMREEKDALLRVMQRAECVEISERDASLADYQPGDQQSLAQTDEKLSRLQWAISRLSRYAHEKTGMLQSMSIPTADESEALDIARDEDRWMGIVAQVEDYERQIGDLRGTEMHIRAKIDQLLPWRMLDIPFDRLGDTRETSQCVGMLPSRRLTGLKNALETLPAVIRHVGDERDSALVWIVYHRSEEAAVWSVLKEASFSKAQLDVEAGTAAERLDSLHARMRELSARRAQINEAQKVLSSEIYPLRLFYEMVSAAQSREVSASRLAETETAFYLEGWVPAAACEKLLKKLREVSTDCVVEFRDATGEESPPTMLHNHRFINPYESVVVNFSWPDYKGWDPTFIMAPFFLCFFGMMVSDAGYGLLMAILIPLVIHFAKPKPGLSKIMWILAIGGVVTVGWGIVFDTYFGASIRPMLLNPLEEPLSMIAVCLGFGAVHLFTGLFIAAYLNFKRGQPWNVLMDQLSWLVLLVGLPLMLLPRFAAIGKIMAILGAGTIVLTAGRDKENFAKRLVSGFGALYGVTSWLSDLLSYMRLFGMGLATGVIGMVINMLVGLMMGKNIVFTAFGIVVLIGGHLFNAGINVMGAYIHSCRLQYIEFFGKFFEDGGRPFKPLGQETRYIAIRKPDSDRVS